MFWILAVAMTAVVAGVLALALRRGGRLRADEAQRDVAFYKAQLAEVDRDLARGVLSAEEAESVRTEIARRLLEADRRAGQGGAAAARGVPVWGALALGLAVLGSGLAVYYGLGAPGYPDQPLRARLAAAEEFHATRPGQAEVEARLETPDSPPPDATPEYLELVERLREAVAGRPDDIEGLRLLAQQEARLGRYAEAHKLLGRIVEVKGEAADAQDWVNLADMLVIAAGGYVSPEAERALKAALQLDPANGTALYYMGLMMAQIGRPDRAFAIWRDLYEKSAPDDPWVAPIEAQLETVAAEAGIRYRLPGGDGPSAADVAAAGQMSAEERQQMIEGMVAGLAERLTSDGGPPEDWARLIRSLAVLGRADEAARILDEARGRYQADAAALQLLEAAGRDAGALE